MATPAFEERNAYFDRLFNTDGLMWLGQNTNHIPVHSAVRQAMHDCIAREEFHAYAPPAGFERLRSLIKADLGLPEASVLVTDGAVGGLAEVCRTLLRPGDRMVTTDPSWKWPLLFARRAGAEVTEIPIYGDEYGWRLSPERLAAAVDERTRIIYLVDPNNPLGICYTAAEIAAFCEIARGAGAWFLHDSTYRDFADSHTLAARFLPERTLTHTSFSKWLGLAGMRVGALTGAPETIATIAAGSPNVLGSSVLAQRAAIAGLEVKAEWMPQVQRIQRRNQAKIAEAVARIPGMRVPVYPSQANFLVVECAGAGLRPEALVHAFQQHGVMIRQGSYHTPRFGDRFVKVSTTVPEQWADTFCALLGEAVDAARRIETVPSLF